MPGNTASLTFKLFGVDVNASRTISGVGVAAAGTAKDLQVLSTGTLKFVAAAGAAGVASVGLAGVLGAGLGVAFAGVGVAAALMNKNVAKEFKTLGQGIKNQISAAAKPVQDSMLQLFKYISQSIKTMGPLFHTFFAAVAPLVTIIGHGLVQAVANLVGEFTPLVKIVTPIVKELFAQLPDLIGNIAFTLKEILAPLSGNTKAFGMLLQTIGSLLPIVGSIIGSLVRLGQQIMPTFQRAILSVGTALDSGLMKVLPLVSKAIQVMLPPIAHLVSSLFPALAAILKALLPPLSGVVAALAGALAKVLPQIVPGFVALIQVVGQLLKGIQPLLPSLVFLAVWISKVANNLLSALLPVATAILGALLPALKVLLPIIISVAIQVGDALAAAFKQAAPSLVLLAKAVGQILTALTPLIPVVVAAALSFLPIIPAAAKIASVLAQGLVPIVLALTPLLVMLAPTLVKIAIAAKLWTVAQGILNVVLAANPIGIVIIAVAALAAGIIYAYKHSQTFRDIVTKVFDGIKTAIRVAVDFIITVIRGWFNAQAAVVIGIISLFAKLPGPMGAPFRALKGVAERARTDVNNALDKIKKTVDVTFQGHDKVNSVIKQINSEMKASGFSVTARLVRGGTAAQGLHITEGTHGTADDVPIWASKGETVVPVRAHTPGFVSWAKGMGIKGFAAGGRIGWPADVNLEASRDTLMSRLGAGGLFGNIGRSAKAILDFIRFVDRLPYLWGGVGPGAYDCSGLVGEIWNRITGNKSFVRRWTTAAPTYTMGFKQIKGPYNYTGKTESPLRPHAFTVGLELFAGGGHTAGQFLGLGFEAANRRAGIRIGGDARSVGSFPYVYYLPAADQKYLGSVKAFDRGGWLPPGLSMAYNGTGRPERVGGSGGVTLNFYGPVYGDKAAFVRDVTPALRQAFRQARRAEGRPADTV